MSNYDKAPVQGSLELLTDAKASAMRISAMYSDPQYKESIAVIVADPGGSPDYSQMLGGSDKGGGKTGIQKWFEMELETIGRISGPEQLRVYYSRLKKKMEELEAYIKRV